MAIAATSPEAIAVDKVKDLIANTSFFQTWTGAGSAAAAKAYIVVGGDGVNVKSFARASNVATIITEEAHGLSASGNISVRGIDDDDDANGEFTVATVVDTHTFTYANTGSDVTANETRSGSAVVLATHRPALYIAESEDEYLSAFKVAHGVSVFSGAIDILIDADVSAAYKNNPEDAKIEMSNNFGGLISAINQLEGTADYIHLNSIEVKERPAFIEKGLQKDKTRRFESWQAVLMVTWGLNG